MLKASAASATELDDLRAAVAAAARDPGTVFHQARIHQVYGRGLRRSPATPVAT